MEMTIITNGKPRPLLALADLPIKDQADFTYITEEEKYDTRLFRYLGSYYDTHEGFDRTTSPELSEWLAVQPDSYFSATAYRYASDHCGFIDYDYVVVARIHW